MESRQVRLQGLRDQLRLKMNIRENAFEHLAEAYRATLVAGATYDLTIHVRDYDETNEDMIEAKKGLKAADAHYQEARKQYAAAVQAYKDAEEEYEKALEEAVENIHR